MATQPIEVGSRRQLFIDDFWFDSQENIQLTMHPPELREVVVTCDRPWEKGLMHYSVVILDEGRYRMWYRVDAVAMAGQDALTWMCYAESGDGIHWEKPNLGLVSWEGSTENNIIYPSETVEGINGSIIMDPNGPVDERYKMITRSSRKPVYILGYVSADGIRWRAVEANPLVTEGPFDSHNILLWDDERERYVIYMRGVDGSIAGSFFNGRRAIRRSESADFRHWTKPELVVTPDENDPDDLHFYTNAAHKYERAERSYFMFPMVLYPERVYPDAPLPGLSDVQFATSRDGIHWERRFRQPFIAPGLDERNWVDRNPIMGTGMVPTGPDELSMYYSEFFRDPATRLRRCTVRPDGFVSVEGPYRGWSEFVTRPIVFSGRRLGLNYGTSGGGSLFVELQTADGSPLPGFALADCAEIFGDKIEGNVVWKGGDDVRALAGQAVRLRVRLRDAHLFAFRFSV